MSRDVTSIEIKKPTWRELNQLKEDPGDSFDDVIQRLLHGREQPKETEEEPANSGTPEADAIYDCHECDFETDDWDEWDEHRREEHDIEP